MYHLWKNWKKSHWNHLLCSVGSDEEHSWERLWTSEILTRSPRDEEPRLWSEEKGSWNGNVPRMRYPLQPQFWLLSMGILTPSQEDVQEVEQKQHNTHEVAQFSAWEPVAHKKCEFLISSLPGVQPSNEGLLKKTTTDIPKFIRGFRTSVSPQKSFENQTRKYTYNTWFLDEPQSSSQ